MALAPMSTVSTMLTAVRAIHRCTERLLERNLSFGSTPVKPAIISCGRQSLLCSSSAVSTHSGHPANFNTCTRNVGELPGALKFPDKAFKEKYGFEKPKENDHIVFFCASGSRSQRAMNAAVEMGYKNLCITRSYSQSANMSGGISPNRNLTYDELTKLIERKEIYLVDVREPHELQETGELPGSVNIPLPELREALGVITDSEFQKKYKARKPSLDANVVFSCRSGARSLKALQLALDLGYSRAKHYKGGFLDWEAHKKQQE